MKGMQVQLKNPELEQFIDDEVKSGHFRSHDEAVEAAVRQMKLERQYELTDEDAAAIEDGESQLDRGEGRPWEELRVELQAKYLRK